MIEIDPTSPVPLYLQISRQIRKLIALGALRPDERLPTVRDLAVKARVNRNTAARAIQHLESEGLVRTRIGQGTFVDRAIGPGRQEDRDAILERLIDRLLVEAGTSGVSLEDLAERLKRRIEAFRKRRASVRPAGSGEADGAEERR